MFHVRDITRGCCEMPRNAAKKMLRWHSLVTTPLKFPGETKNPRSPTVASSEAKAMHFRMVFGSPIPCKYKPFSKYIGKCGYGVFMSGTAPQEIRV